MKFKATLEYDSATGHLTLNGADCVRQGDSFSLLLRPDAAAQAGKWRDTLPISDVRLTFDKQDKGWICSDITVDSP